MTLEIYYIACVYHCSAFVLDVCCVFFSLSGEHLATRLTHLQLVGDLSNQGNACCKKKEGTLWHSVDVSGSWTTPTPNLWGDQG